MRDACRQAAYRRQHQHGFQREQKLDFFEDKGTDFSLRWWRGLHTIVFYRQMKNMALL
jgi:hypothetical protein